MLIADTRIPFLLTLLAGLASCVGGVVFLFIKNFTRAKLAFALGLSAGAMIYVSFVELLRLAIMDIGFLHANLIFFAGIAVIASVNHFLPSCSFFKGDDLSPKNSRILRSGIMVAIGLAIHNFPEGMAVFLSGLVSVKLGMTFALAIAAHNIPEGIAVAAPIYYATKNRAKAFWYSFLSGMLEPVGALVVMFFLGPTLNKSFISMTFAFVAGIMVFISFNDLIPQAFSGKHHRCAMAGVLIGFLMIMLSLSV